jgi:MFS family permease
MHAELAVLAFVVAGSAAVYSTWSPCGLSMLSQLTPVAERARGNRFRVSSAWFMLGALTGGATLGAGVAGLTAVVRAIEFPSEVAAAAAALVALSAAALDARVLPWAPPFFRRQVNEDWLTSYRSWVYGLGFGWQIGAGITTYVMTSAVFVLIALGALSASPWIAFAAAMTFAIVRGLAVFASAFCSTYEELLSFHRRMAMNEPLARRGVVGVLVLVAGTAAMSARGWLGLVAIAACAAAAGAWARRPKPQMENSCQVSGTPLSV